MANTSFLLNKESNEYKQLEARAAGGYGETINATGGKSLTRYFELLKVGRKNVRRIFTEHELQLLADICNGTVFEPLEMILTNNGLLMQFEDSADDGYCEKWSVDENQIKSKLMDLSVGEQLALIDAIEIFWAGSDKYPTLLECLKDLR